MTCFSLMIEDDLQSRQKVDRQLSLKLVTHADFAGVDEGGFGVGVRGDQAAGVEVGRFEDLVMCEENKLRRTIVREAQHRLHRKDGLRGLIDDVCADCVFVVGFQVARQNTCTQAEVEVELFVNAVVVIDVEHAADEGDFSTVGTASALGNFFVDFGRLIGAFEFKTPGVVLQSESERARAANLVFLIAVTAANAGLLGRNEAAAGADIGLDGAITGSFAALGARLSGNG